MLWLDERFGESALAAKLEATAPPRFSRPGDRR
jgi:hypothetical protein